MDCLDFYPYQILQIRYIFTDLDLHWYLCEPTPRHWDQQTVHIHIFEEVISSRIQCLTCDIIDIIQTDRSEFLSASCLARYWVGNCALSITTARSKTDKGSMCLPFLSTSKCNTGESDKNHAPLVPGSHHAYQISCHLLIDCHCLTMILLRGIITVTYPYLCTRMIRLRLPLSWSTTL